MIYFYDVLFLFIFNSFFYGTKIHFKNGWDKQIFIVIIVIVILVKDLFQKDEAPVIT